MATIRASFSKTGAFFSLPQPTSYRSQKDILYPLILSHVFNLHAMKKDTVSLSSHISNLIFAFYIIHSHIYIFIYIYSIL